MRCGRGSWRVRAGAGADRSGLPLQHAERAQAPGWWAAVRTICCSTRCWSVSRLGGWSAREAGSARTARAFWRPCTTCTCSSWWPSGSRAALDDLAALAPEWLRGVVRPIWFERYGRRVEDYRLPKRREEREALALDVGADGFHLLDVLDAPGAPLAARGPTDGWAACATSGACTTRAATTAGRAGGPERSCRRWASGCSRPTTRRCTTARSGGSSGRATWVARHRGLRRGRRARDHERADVPGDAARHGPSTAAIHERLAGKGLLPGPALRGPGLRRCGPSRRWPARSRRLARGAGSGHGAAADPGGASLRAAPLPHRLGPRAGHLPAARRRSPGAPARARSAPRASRPCSAAPTAAPAPPARLGTPAKDARRSVRFHPRPHHEALQGGAGADARPRAEAPPPRARRHRGHALAGRARLRDAPEPVRRAGQNRAPAGLHRRV